MIIEIPDDRDEWGDSSFDEDDAFSEDDDPSLGDDPTLGNDPTEDSLLVSAADVSCPYCGALVSMMIDPAGGSRQKYVEDCEVCCQPWSVVVQFDGWGNAEVVVEQSY